MLATLSGGEGIATKVRRESGHGVLRSARAALEGHVHFRGRADLFVLTAYEDVLVVRGTAPTYYIKQMLQAVLGQVEGVTRVDNQVVVIQSAGNQQRSSRNCAPWEAPRESEPTMSHETGLNDARMPLGNQPCGRCLTQRLHLPLADEGAECDLEATLMRLIQVCHAYDRGEIDPDWDGIPGATRQNCAFPSRAESLCPLNYVESD